MRLPGAKSSNDRPLPLKQSQEHTGQRDLQKPGCLWGQGRQTKMNFCIIQARVRRCLSAFRNKNPITSQKKDLFQDLDPALRIPIVKNMHSMFGIAAAGLCIKLCGNTVDYFSSYSLLWHKQHLGMHGSDASRSLLKGKTNILNPALLFFHLFIHALFMSNSVSFSHPAVFAQSTAFIITLTFSAPFRVF